MSLVPLQRMQDLVTLDRQASDIALFNRLMYYGEFIAKLVTSTFVAAVADADHQYRLQYRLIRASGIGGWLDVLNDTLTGASQRYLTNAARELQAQMRERCLDGSWQFSSVASMLRCVDLVLDKRSHLPAKITARQWVAAFVDLRNKTRGHGAATASTLASVCKELEASIDTFVSNCAVFQIPWAHLAPTAAGTHRVTLLSSSANPFEYLRTTAAERLYDGVYVFLDGPRCLALVAGDAECNAWRLANGSWKDETYEALSYHTGARTREDASAYTVPPIELPASETQGLDDLALADDTFINLPLRPKSYIRRAQLEERLTGLLSDTAIHRIVTLVGRGGIGKTSLALTVLHDLCAQDTYAAIIWFSARDVDLLPDGPKPTKLHLADLPDVAREFVRLVGTSGLAERAELAYLARNMHRGDLGPILFVFDNFETTRSPIDLYEWIDANLRAPNKVLITTRIRHFRGDYAFEVGGMTAPEAQQLIAATAERLRIKPLLDSYVRTLIAESEGHPYIIRVIMGEVAKTGRTERIKHVVATKDEVLNALFGRTFDALSATAQRLFLTLGTWRSAVPQWSIEAVMLPSGVTPVEAERALEELERTSMVEVTESTFDGARFLTVPLAAALFGKRILATSPLRTIVDADAARLRLFGATTAVNVSHGFAPHARNAFRNAAEHVSTGKMKLAEVAVMLELIAENYPSAWLDLAAFYQDHHALAEAIRAMQRHIATRQDAATTQDWEMLADFARAAGNHALELHARIEMATRPDTQLSRITVAASRVNQLLREQSSLLDKTTKRTLVTKLVDVIEPHVSALQPSDCSNVGWLYVQIGRRDRAMQFAQRGLQLEPSNPHCAGLLRSLAEPTLRPR